MWAPNHFPPAALALLATLSLSPSTYAADLKGAGASDASVCSKVFAKSNNRISFMPDAELYGGGFLVEGDRATGTFQKCNSKSIKDDGTDVHMIAACSTGVEVSNLQFNVEIVGHDQITVSSNGAVSVTNSYVRCPI
jgi:hypothetical protein